MNQTRIYFPLIILSLSDSNYPTIPKRAGYTGSWPTTGAIHMNTTITAIYTPDSSIVIPTQPTSPGELMSGGEGEPVEADVPAKDETVAPQGTHVTGTQTVTHEYLTLNGKVARETIKTNDTLTAVLDFVYDESGKPFALKYSTDGTSFATYYYVLNLQGDVVKLIQANGHVVAQYTYDAWGNILDSGGNLAEVNPLRYRGYYYDNETGFYYLQSRYYDPANRRFINADIYSSTDSSDAVSCNMFAYCRNNPINMDDSTGTLPKWLETVAKVVAVAAVVVTATAVVAVSTVASGGTALAVAGVAFGTACGGLVGGIANEASGESFINGWAGGAVNGLAQSVATTVLGPVGTIVGGGIGSGAGTAITENLNNIGRPKEKQKSSEEILKGSLKSTIVGAATSTMTAGINYAFDSAVVTQASGLMPGLTRPFGEMSKGFFGSVDDALTYIMCM